MNYATPAVNIGQGDTLTFTNLDQLARHDLVGENDAFKSELLAGGESGPVTGVDKLTQGTFEFHCTLHSWMRGVLNVGPAGSGAGAPSTGDVQSNPASGESPDPADLNQRAVAEKIGAGEWPFYGHDLANSRDGGKNGPAPGDILNMGVAWSFFSSHGDFTGTPVVAGGKVAVGSNTGRVFVIDASTGEELWHKDVDGPVNGTVAIDSGRVIVPVASPHNPRIAVFNVDSGKKLWETVVSDQKDSDVYGSPVAFDGKVFIGTSAEYGETSDADVATRGTVVALSEKTGQLLWRTFTVPEGHDGGSVWTTPAVDPATKRLVVGTGNAYHEPAHDNIDSILTLDTGSGRILDAFHAYPGDVWNATGNATAGPDYDFGASPQLIKGADGKPLIGAGQKNGTYWALDAATLKPAWSAMTGPPTPVVGGIVGSTAYDGNRIFGPNTADGETWALDRSGGLSWVSADAPAHFNAISVANGVVYTNDLSGYLIARDAASGLILGRFPLGSPSWGGVSIAGGSVFTSVGMGGGTGYIVAFRKIDPNAKPAKEDADPAPERVAEPKACPRKKAKAKKRKSKAKRRKAKASTESEDGSDELDSQTEYTPQQSKPKCIPRGSAKAKKKHGKKAKKKNAKKKKTKKPASNPPWEPKPDFVHHLKKGQDPHEHIHPKDEEGEGYRGGPSHPIQHRSDRFVTKPAGTKETLKLWYGPYTIGPGQDLNRVDIDLPLRTGFLVSLEPKLVKWPDMTSPSHQVAHIHHAHWFRPEPGNKEDNYFYGNAEWIFGLGDEETRGDFQPRSAAGGDNGPLYGQYFGGGQPQPLIYMLHNKTAAPFVGYVVLEVTFIHGTAEQNEAIFHRPFHDVSGILFGRTYNVPHEPDGDGLYETTVDKAGSKEYAAADPRLKKGPIRWTSTLDGTIVGMGGHLHPGGIRVVVNNLGSKERPCPNDGTTPYGGTQLFTSKARYRYTPWTEDFLMEVTDPGFRAPIRKGDVIEITGVYENKLHAWYDVMTHLGVYVDPAQPPKDGCAPTIIDHPKANPHVGVLSKPWGPEHDHSCGIKWGWGDCEKPIKGNMKLQHTNTVHIANFAYTPGDYSSGIFGDTPWIRQGEQLTFINDDQPLAIRHSVTTCPYPCNGTYVANYPLADGRWDSGTLGYDPIDGGSPNPVSQTPPNLEPGTYTYFCRIHPWMRGAFKVLK